MKSIINATRPLVEKLVDLYKYQLESNNHNTTKNLSNSIKYEIQFDGRIYEVNLLLEKYWKWLEYGRKPGKQPPIAPVEDWIKVKRIIPRSINGKVPTTKQLAFAISKSIGEHGTPAYKPLKKAMDSPEFTSIVQSIQNTIINEINKEIKDVIKPISQ